MKRISVMLLSTTMMLGLLAGCQSGEDTGDNTGESQKEKIDLKIMILSEDSNRQAIYQDYYSKASEVFPDYNIEFELPGSASNYTSKLTVYNSSEELPDIFWGEDIVYQSGQAMPLTDVMAETGFIDKYSNPSALIPAPDGEIYCLSAGTDSYFAGPLFYNKDIFEAEGLEIPTSYEGFVELIQTLKDKGYTPISATAWALQNFMFQDLMTAEDPEAMIKLQNKEIGFDDPLVIEAATKLKELTDMGAFPVDVTSIEQQVHEQLFIDGSAAMIYHPIWVYPAIETAEFEIAHAYLPEILGAENIVNAWGSATAGGFMISNNSENKDAAVEVAEWLVEQDAKYWNQIAGNATAIKGYDAIPETSPQVNKDFYERIKSEDTTVVTNFATNYLNRAQQSEYQTNVEKLISGQMSPEEFGTAMSGIYS